MGQGVSRRALFYRPFSSKFYRARARTLPERVFLGRRANNGKQFYFFMAFTNKMYSLCCKFNTIIITYTYHVFKIMRLQWKNPYRRQF